MTNTSNNPPAFPRPYSEGVISGVHIASPAQQGISMRDYFAAAALQGLIAQTDKEQSAKVFAKQAYICADAMLAAREES